jgi:hypothetical protein
MGKENFEEGTLKLTQSRDNYIKPHVRFVVEKYKHQS